MKEFPAMNMTQSLNEYDTITQRRHLEISLESQKFKKITDFLLNSSLKTNFTEKKFYYDLILGPTMNFT